MPRTRSLAWSELKIGLLALGAVVLAAIIIFLVGGQSGFPWQRYALKTRFGDVQGLKAGAVVRVAGVEVGSVTDVRFAGSDVEVEMELHDSVNDKITTESRASLGSLSLLGEGVIDITASSKGQPLPDGAHIPSVRRPGQIADVAEHATEGLQEATRLLQDIRAGRGTVGKLFTEEELYRELTSFVNAAEDVAIRVKGGRGTLGRLTRDPAAYEALEGSLANLRAITTRINAGEGSLGRLVRDESLATSLSSTGRNLDDLTGRLKRGEGTAGKLVTDDALYNRLASVSSRLDVVVTRLNAGEGTAGRLLQDRQLYENMNTAVVELRSLIADIRKDPKKFLNVRVSIF